MIITAGWLGEQLCWSEPVDAFLGTHRNAGHATLLVSAVDAILGTHRVDYAKFRDLEVRAAEQGAELARLEGLQLTVLQDVILCNLEPELCGILVNLRSYDKAPIELAHLERLRRLRDRGLIQHNGARLGQSSEVWLTPLGKEVAELLTRPRVETGRQVTDQHLDQLDHQV